MVSIPSDKQIFKHNLHCWNRYWYIIYMPYWSNMPWSSDHHLYSILLSMLATQKRPTQRTHSSDDTNRHYRISICWPIITDVSDINILTSNNYWGIGYWVSIYWLFNTLQTIFTHNLVDFFCILYFVDIYIFPNIRLQFCGCECQFLCECEYSIHPHQ